MYSRFKQLITEKGITPYRVAKETGVSQVTLSDWKNGRTTPRVHTLQKIAKYLGVKIDDLIGGDDNAETKSED